MNMQGPWTDRSRKATQYGISLIELWVSMSILVVLLSTAIPSFSAIYVRTNVRADLLAISQATIIARAQAAKMRKPVTLCFTNAQQVCTRQGSSGVITVYVDDNSNGRMDPSESPIMSSSLSGKGRYVARLSGGRNRFRFMPEGHTKEFGRIKLCDYGTGNQTSRAEMVVNRAGRFRSTRVQTQSSAYHCG